MAKLVLKLGATSEKENVWTCTRFSVPGEFKSSRARAQPSASIPSQGTYVSLVPDVTSTGAVGRVAEPPVGQVPSGIAESTPGLATGENKQLGKAEELLRVGDIVGARWVLEHALPRGNPLVAFKLAETYDAQRLAAWGVVGIRGDATKARALYQRAHAGGVQQARERVADVIQK